MSILEPSTVRKRMRRFISDESIKEEDSSRYQSHGLFPYPAMMVPRLQGVLIDELLGSSPTGKVIFDPFMGSGTVLSESVSRGIDFYGTDINPLSMLCCKVKSDFFELGEAEDNIDALEAGLSSAVDGFHNFHFSIAEKWFDPVVYSALMHIRKEIKRLGNAWCRRIFWLALAESVRRFSRTRLSTYKLHIDKNQRSAHTDEILDYFVSVCRRNIALRAESWRHLDENGMLCSGRPISNVHLELTDTRCMRSSFKADLVVTSPPYGDNQTTVTYGQFSFLPLNFIDLDDIGSKFDRSLLQNISGIDSASLGGSLKFWRERLGDVENQSESLRHTLEELKAIGKEGERRLSSFSYDLHQSMVSMSQRVKNGGYAMITLGNRKINGLPIPLDEIVEEFLISLGFVLVTKVKRKIKKKRMAGSMSDEKILIMQKC